ncbi:MAG: hypothetical protein DWQ34_24360 [Planctomycetota bacterium]|nr:MAG: hypothetical protein DWQ34_24360 [Planctomycetota bacterium]REJ96936.1 MAG: hypothetical protein DWQ29_00485 [Planctomycetota bacterium]REK27864.1 MAG: hypothetical protein DWQ41_07110 [Planctomycetota bacterium]REK32824.1 MAG: hypothetical protein DWQ45_16575 [Planctomycetota bacterium]
MTTQQIKSGSQVSLQDDVETLPFSLPLELTVRDTEVIAALWEYADGDAREEFALRALRIGVLALQQAQGQIDAGAVRQEGERLLKNVEGALEKHQQLLNERMTSQLKDYFDPQNGRFQERVERLIRQDGELEQVLRRNIGEDDSELCRTLAAHIGDQSPVMQLLDPEGSDGLTAELRKIVEEKLHEQRQRLLEQFSLDTEEGALCRFLGELRKHYDGVSGDLTEKIDKAVGEFSLDDDNSALSRLVTRVKTAQETITKEFSLDEEKSALSRLRNELTTLLKDQTKTNQEFQEEVKVAIRELQARKKEAERSTRHGHTFEEQLYAFVEGEALRVGDVAEFTGNTTGLRKNCKVGDVVLALNPESAAAGAKIVLEAKKKAHVKLAQALEESETARKNRGAQVGLFVFSQGTAPEEMEPVMRYGEDVVVVWDHEDPSTDIYLKVALTLARALCVREQRSNVAEAADLEQIDRAVIEIEKRAGQLDEIKSGAESIKRSADKILKRQDLIREALNKEVAVLQERTSDLRSLLGESDGG